METERNWSGNGASGEGHDDQRQALRGLKQTAISKAQEAKEQMRSLADSGKDEVCNQIDGFAKALKSTSEQLRSEEQGAQIGAYTDFVSDQAERVASFLRERDAAALVGEVENFARRQPLIFLGGCVVAGVAIGRFFKASPPMNDELEFRSSYATDDVPTGNYQASNYQRPNYDNYATDTQFGAGFAPSEFAKTPATRSTFNNMDQPSTTTGVTNTRSSVVTAPVEPIGGSSLPNTSPYGSTGSGTDEE